MSHRFLVSFLLCASLFVPGAVGQTPAPAPESTAEASAPPQATDQVAPVIEPSGEPEPNAWKRFPRNLLEDQKAIWTSPFRMSKQDAKWWVLFGGATAGFIAGDYWLSRQLPNTSDQIAVARWTSRIGASYSIIPITASVYLYGRLTDSPRARETGRIGLETLVNAAIVNATIKAVTRRERPLQGDGHGTFWSKTGGTWDASFPSGHATYSFALASVVAHEFPRPRIVPITAYALATTVGASRFAVRKHFASDIIVGGAIGWFIGHYVYGKRHNAELDTLRGGVRNWIVTHVEFQPVYGGLGAQHCATPPACGMLR
ncbi:MAG TPA: phosphatase PAP2 family protein [Bryobacteraceae bacterium]|nr:phosphatase PAP2 family protein [Bryobacteraceae bacterium]